MNDDITCNEGAWKTCDASQLEMETRHGWRLQEIVTSCHQEPGFAIQKQVPDARGGIMYLTEGTPPVTVAKPIFVLVRSRDAELTDLRNRLGVAEGKVTDAMKLAETAVAEKTTSDTVLQGLKDALEALNERFIESMDRNKTINATKQRLESDLGKLRKELGESRWREILSNEAGVDRG